LISQLFRDAEALLLQELALARAEIGENLSRAVGGTTLILAGVATAFSGGLALIAALVLLLGHVVPLWIACALVGIGICATSLALALYGRYLVAMVVVLPRRAVQSLHETDAWAREELT